LSSPGFQGQRWGIQTSGPVASVPEAMTGSGVLERFVAGDRRL
jgi:hypothetical protein